MRGTRAFLTLLENSFSSRGATIFRGVEDGLSPGNARAMSNKG
jgi:hypothetical protein